MSFAVQFLTRTSPVKLSRPPTLPLPRIITSHQQPKLHQKVVSTSWIFAVHFVKKNPKKTKTPPKKINNKTITSNDNKNKSKKKTSNNKCTKKDNNNVPPNTEGEIDIFQPILDEAIRMENSIEEINVVGSPLSEGNNNKLNADITLME